MFDADFIKKQFPIFQTYPNLVYLDSAATSQKPAEVIEALSSYYTDQNSNIHRGVYDLSAQATKAYEKIRADIGSFINAESEKTIAFTKGTTESINAVAQGFLSRKLKPGNNIAISAMEHHANLLPWQYLCRQKDCELRVIPVDSNGDLQMGTLERLLDSNTRFLGITHISNTLGTVNDIRALVEKAHAQDIPVLVDAAQSFGLYPLDMKEWDVDFLAFSAHKAFGPMGVGILYTKEKYHAQIQPYNLGGGIVQHVSFEESTFQKYPHNLEAGTPNVEGVIGLETTLQFLRKLDRPGACEHVKNLGTYARQLLSEVDEVQIIGSPKEYSGIVSFLIGDIHPHDAASFLNQDGIAVRAGHHCTQPLLEHLGVPATIRVSFSIYNTKEDVEHLAHSLKELIAFWS